MGVISRILSCDRPFVESDRSHLMGCSGSCTGPRSYFRSRCGLGLSLPQRVRSVSRTVRAVSQSPELLSMCDDVTGFVVVIWLLSGLTLGAVFITGFDYAMGCVLVTGMFYMKVRDGNMPVTRLE